MRAKLFLAAAILVTALQPVVARDLVLDVRDTLYPVETRGLLSDLLGAPRVIDQRAVLVNGCMQLPAVVMKTDCGAAIVSRDPMDLDIRREELVEKINCLSKAGALSAAEVRVLGCAMTEVNQAEVNMRMKGDLTNREARRLYRAMDKIGTEADWLSRDSRIGLNSYIGMSSPGYFY